MNAMMTMMMMMMDDNCIQMNMYDNHLQGIYDWSLNQIFGHLSIQSELDWLVTLLHGDEHSLPVDIECHHVALHTSSPLASGIHFQLHTSIWHLLMRHSWMLMTLTVTLDHSFLPSNCWRVTSLTLVHLEVKDAYNQMLLSSVPLSI